MASSQIAFFPNFLAEIQQQHDKFLEVKMGLCIFITLCSIWLDWEWWRREQHIFLKPLMLRWRGWIATPISFELHLYKYLNIFCLCFPLIFSDWRENCLIFCELMSKWFGNNLFHVSPSVFFLCGGLQRIHHTLCSIVLLFCLCPCWTLVFGYSFCVLVHLQTAPLLAYFIFSCF